MTAEPREGLRDAAPYVSPQLTAIAARLNTNESPHRLPETFFDELAAAIHDLPLNRYPDGSMRRLRDELSAIHGWTPDGTWAANGSNEVLTQLLQAYGGPGRRALVFEPTYLMHARIGRLTHTAIERRHLPADFVLSDAEVDAARETAADVVFVCSPNNPTGNAQPPSIVEAIAEALPGSLVIVDEAYGEFAPASSARPLLDRFDNVAVVRTFSKAFAMAGARVGYVLAAPSVVGDLERVRLPYHLSVLAQTAAIVALRHRAEALQLLDAVRGQRGRIAAELAVMAGVTVFPSEANFVLFIPPGDVGAVWQGLVDRGVLIRDMTGVVPGALRVTAGSEQETDVFLRSLKEVLG
jgi:histidinol-phosphate aminotransferase